MITNKTNDSFEAMIKTILIIDIDHDGIYRINTHFYSDIPNINDINHSSLLGRIFIVKCVIPLHYCNNNHNKWLDIGRLYDLSLDRFLKKYVDL